jgi:hypothetical protein
MRRLMTDLLRRAVGTKQVLDGLARLEAVVRNKRVGVEQAAPAEGALEILPGTQYSQYAIPVDYKPSRAFAPRYGYTHGKIERLAQWFAAHNAEYRKFLEDVRALKLESIPVNLSPGSALAPAWIGGPICAFDALALYAMIKRYAPRTYLEIGSGMSTCFARQAITDAGLKTNIISIDPQPRREIDAICDRVVRDGLETCDLVEFDRLSAGDILFFDGSHRSFMNSDVTVFFIDVLPRLKPGVIVHVHDITLPWDYPEMFKHWYWNEQYLLAVYLMAAMDGLHPVLPTAWICRASEFNDFFEKPVVDLGSSEVNASWRGGGSMWFTKKG